MNRNLQPGIHPDADRLSVFVEGAATVREQEKMLAHLGECAECRKAVFLMRPHEETQPAAATPEKGWLGRWLVPVGLPAAALACGLIAVLIYIRPHGSTETPQQIAKVRPPEIERPATAAPTTESEQAPSTNSQPVARPEKRQNTFTPNPTAPGASGREKHIENGLNLPPNRSGQASTGAAPQISIGGPIISVPTSEAAAAQSTITSATVSNLPLNGRNVTDLQQLQSADSKGAASQNALAMKKELPALQIQAASAQNEMLAGVSGRITDRSGAVVAGVTVILRDATGKTRQTTTGADGSFRLTELPAGQYELTATARGFKTNQQSIDLKPSELAMMQPVLDVGATSETVEVSGGTVQVQTESANVSGQQATAEMNGVSRASPVPSGLPVAETVSHGKQFLSLDDAGNLFLSRNGGKKWKKVKPQWAGKAARIELASRSVTEATQGSKDESSPAASEGAVFLLTTDGGVVWSSKDGAHWYR